ncbi:MAG TPA: ABC-F family ATP-binding cassette domain-containing protein, partial [Myxococcota bacterium]|nr:ABC-F family ATP-binding cassette domain-containing protein [Myxococcota bacterium]
PGDRIGLLGANGSGKSTLLKLLAGDGTPDVGSIARRQGLRVSRLEQVPRLPPGSIAEALAAPLRPLLDCIARYEADPHGAGAGALLERIEALGGWDWQHRVARAASSLDVVDLERDTSQLSGGYQKRVALARLLLEDPELILLDEPTNHLDTDTVEWLEKWLGSASIAAVVVTHDRAFLEAVADRMAELRQGVLRVYGGNYSDYLVARATEEALEERTTARRLRLLETELDWARRSPKARTTKNRARLERIETAQATLAARVPQQQVRDLSLGSAPRLGKTILTFEAMAAGFTADAPLFEPLSMHVTAGERWGIIGPNGAGKTTLLRAIAGELPAARGKVTLGVNTQVAYFDQHRTALDPEQGVRDVLVPEGGDTVFPDGKPVHVASWLARFAFPPQAHTLRVGQLSGGEKNRLALARFMLQPANLLLLDEPTNDLDLLTLSVLEDALLDFEGCVFVV